MSLPRREARSRRICWTSPGWFGAGQETDGTSLLSLKQRLNDITAEQALLLESGAGKHG